MLPIPPFYGKQKQPRYILELFPEARIAVTQPRRMAAVNLAKRVAKAWNFWKLALFKQKKGAVIQNPGCLLYIYIYIPSHPVIPPEVWSFRHIFGVQIPKLSR